MEAKSYSEETIINPYPDKKGFNVQREAWDDGFKMGIKEVVSFLAENYSKELYSAGLFQVVIPSEEWISKLKEWGR